MLVPNRKGTTEPNLYRYGFQDQEDDWEIKGEGNSINYTFRMHDPRVGRFFAVDPLTYKYPWYSPYQFGGNSPIMSIELEGLEESKTANENQNSKEELSIFEQAFLGVVETFDNWSKIKGVNKYKGDTFPEQIANSLEGFKEFATNDTFLFLGAINQPGFRFDFGADDYANDAIKFSPKINFTFKSTQEFLSNLKKYKIFQVSGSVNFKTIFNGTSDFKKLFPLTVDDWKWAVFGKAWGRVDGKQIVYYTMAGNKGLQMEINLPKNMQGLGYGAEFFATAVRESEATVFTATWVRSGIYETGQSVNLTKYQSALSKGLTAEEAAFKTWSGQQAAKHGFKNVKVTEIENGVEATFTKY